MELSQISPKELNPGDGDEALAAPQERPAGVRPSDVAIPFPGSKSMAAGRGEIEAARQGLLVDTIPLMTILIHMTKKSISLAEAKSHLSELVVRAAYGNEEFLITRRGKPAALLTSARTKGERAHLADAKGWMDNHDPFFENLERARHDSRRRGPRILH